MMSDPSGQPRAPSEFRADSSKIVIARMIDVNHRSVRVTAAPRSVLTGAYSYVNWAVTFEARSATKRTQWAEYPAGNLCVIVCPGGMGIDW